MIVSSDREDRAHVPMRRHGRINLHPVAARNGWPGRYRQAQVAIRRSDRALAAAVAAVR